ncbi:unnamed protein product [Protopolystoma xenopodis]|uniref:ARID domain-containing protein n=1 Tax=Protopolystoma xenopodis TaxID=117903 RepID=A0A448WDE7_9PLAT|nr:unnamed protein product [Protopolystoma xenopodis]
MPHSTGYSPIPSRDASHHHSQHSAQVQAPPTSQATSPGHLSSVSQATFYKLMEMSGLPNGAVEPERHTWLEHYLHFMDDLGKPVTSIPQVVKQPLDLYRFYLAVRERGGLLKVVQAKRWKEVSQAVGINASASAAYTLRKNYVKYLLDYECRFDAGGLDVRPIVEQIESMSGSKKKKAAAAAAANATSASAAVSDAASSAGSLTPSGMGAGTSGGGGGGLASSLHLMPPSPVGSQSSASSSLLLPAVNTASTGPPTGCTPMLLTAESVTGSGTATGQATPTSCSTSLTSAGGPGNANASPLSSSSSSSIANTITSGLNSAPVQSVTGVTSCVPVSSPVSQNGFYSTTSPNVGGQGQVPSSPMHLHHQQPPQPQQHLQVPHQHHMHYHHQQPPQPWMQSSTGGIQPRSEPMINGTMSQQEYGPSAQIAFDVMRRLPPGSGPAPPHGTGSNSGVVAQPLAPGVSSACPPPLQQCSAANLQVSQPHGLPGHIQSYMRLPSSISAAPLVSGSPGFTASNSSLSSFSGAGSVAASSCTATTVTVTTTIATSTSSSATSAPTVHHHPSVVSVLGQSTVSPTPIPGYLPPGAHPHAHHHHHQHPNSHPHHPVVINQLGSASATSGSLPTPGQAPSASGLTQPPLSQHPTQYPAHQATPPPPPPSGHQQLGSSIPGGPTRSSSVSAVQSGAPTSQLGNIPPSTILSEAQSQGPASGLIYSGSGTGLGVNASCPVGLESGIGACRQTQLQVTQQPQPTVQPVLLQQPQTTTTQQQHQQMLQQQQHHLHLASGQSNQLQLPQAQMAGISPPGGLLQQHHHPQQQQQQHQLSQAQQRQAPPQLQQQLPLQTQTQIAGLLHAQSQQQPHALAHQTQAFQTVID